MEVIRFGLNDLPMNNEPLCMALGNFDGVHAGHQRLFLHAAMSDFTSSVLFFSSPFVPTGASRYPCLTSLEDKISIADRMRIKRAYVIEATPELYSLAPSAFMDLLERIGVKEVVVGTDFRFGEKASGTPSELKERFKAKVISLVEKDGIKISTRVIRGLIENGQIEKANDLLGRPYEIKGKVVEGFHNGTKIGFPTVNLELDADYVLPLDGVYAGLVYVDGIPFRAMVNVGKNPTVGKLDHRIVEAHLLDYSGNAYGKTVYVAFIGFVRGEMKFASLHQLKGQLEKDVNTVASMLKR